MRSKLTVAVFVIALFLGAEFDDRAQARTSVSFGVFFDSLSLYGSWISVPDYGYAWYPAQGGPNWQPYNDGRWEWSDQGWLWISYEPWGWATYHYGRWIFDDYYGWIWIPGTTWAPAWVSWYQSPGYIGWSPLPPDNNFFLEIGISFVNYGYGGGYYYGNNNYYYGNNHHYHHHHKKDHYYDNDYYPRRDHYVFVPENKFNHNNARLVALDGPHNLTVIKNVKNVTNITVVNNKIINQGPDRSGIERATRTKLNKLNLVDRDIAVVRGKKDVNTVKGNSYNVYRPNIEKRNGETPFDLGYSGNKHSGVTETHTLRPKVSGKSSNSGFGKVNKSLNSGPVQQSESPNRNNSRYSNQRTDYGIIREQKVNRNPVSGTKTERNTQKGNTWDTPKQIRSRADSPAYKPKNNGVNYAENGRNFPKPAKKNSIDVDARRGQTRAVPQTVYRSGEGNNQTGVRNDKTARNNKTGGTENRANARNGTTRKQQQNNYKTTRNDNPAYRPNQKSNAQPKSTNSRAQRGSPPQYSNTDTKAANNYSNTYSRGNSGAASPNSYNNKSFVQSSGRR